MDGKLPARRELLDVLKIFQKDIPNLKPVLNVSKYSREAEPNLSLSNLQLLRLDAIIQTIGDGHQTDPAIQWEATDYGGQPSLDCPTLGPKYTRCCFPPELCNTLHVASMPGQAYRKIWENWLVYAASRSSVLGVSYPDSVWPWATPGSTGRGGYSRVTVQAFRQDLTSDDEGLEIFDNKGKRRTVNFPEYAESYLGNRPKIEWMGKLLEIRTWSEYIPPSTSYQNLTVDNRNRSPSEWIHAPQLTLFDLLVSYEWLKFQQHLAKFADKNSSTRPARYQVITNPEFLGNGVDWKWLSRLATPIFAANEWFNGSLCADGAYFQAGYFTKHRSPTLALGVSLEAGSGGNSAPYHDIETSYALSYDLSASLGATWLEGDFLPSFSLADMKQACFPVSGQGNCELYLRALALRSYGLGYTHFQQDKVQRHKPNLRVVTSRNFIRPNTTGWRPWEWDITANGDNLATNSLPKLGYQFSGVAEDNEIIDYLDGARVVVYEPLFPLEAGWQQLKRWLVQGKKAVITHAYVWRKPSLSRQYSLVDSAQTDPTLAVDKTAVQACSARSRIQGNGLDFSSPDTYKVYRFRQPVGWRSLIECMTPQGAVPLVSYRNIGRGQLFFVHLDPSEKAVVDSQIIDKVYKSIFAQLSIQPDYKADGVSVHQFTSKNYNVAAVRSHRLDKNQSWRAGNQLMQFSVKASKKNQRYRVRYLLADREGEVRSDSQGWLNFSVPGNNYELIFYREQASQPNAAWQMLKLRSQQLQALFQARTDPQSFDRI